MQLRGSGSGKSQHDSIRDEDSYRDPYLTKGKKEEANGIRLSVV